MAYDTFINEPITTWVLFDPSGHPSKIFPIGILWRSRLIKFKKLIFITNRKIGAVKVTSLVCAGDGANYELEYNNENQTWKLVKVMPKE